NADGSRTESLAFQCGPAGCQAVPISLGRPGNQTVLELFGTGIRGRSSLGGVACAIDGVAAAGEYAGAQPGDPGLDQVNVILPPNLNAQNSITVNLTVDADAANPVTIAIAPRANVDFRARAAQIVSRMTLEEKVAQLHGFGDASQYRTVLGLPRLGIP